MLGVLRAKAGFPQMDELLFQLPQLANALGNMADVFIQERIDLLAVLRGRILELQQHADLVQRHVQAPAMPDERQPLRMLLPVYAVVAFAALRLGQQTLPLVIADGFNGRVGLGRQFADLHACSCQEKVQPLTL